MPTSTGSPHHDLADLPAALAADLGPLRQLRGSCLVLWDDLLPVLDHDTWRTNLATVAARMADEGGRDLT